MERERKRAMYVLQIALILVIAPVSVLLAAGLVPALGPTIPLLAAGLWVGIVTLASWAAGHGLSRRALPWLEGQVERAYFAVVTGLGVLAAISAVLSIVHLLRPSVLLAILAGWACVGAIRMYRSGGEGLDNGVVGLDLLLIPLVLAAGMSLAASTTLAPFFDQWSYHLAFPDQWLRMGSVVTFDRHAYSFFPSNMGLLYVYALAGPGGWAAQTLHWMMGALTAVGAGLIARRLGARSSGILATSAIFFAAPGVIQMGALAGSDLGVSAFGMAAVLALLGREGEEPSPRRIAVVGVFVGLSVGCKYLALATVAVPVALAAILWGVTSAESGSRSRAALTTITLLVLAVGATAGPWFVRNALATGNPTYPYFTSLFEQAGSDAKVSESIGSFEWDADTLEIAVTLGTFHRRGHSGDLGPVFLALAPLSVWWAWRNRRRRVVAAVSIFITTSVVLWALGPPLGRYLLTPIAGLAAVIGAGWADVLANLGRFARGVASFALTVLLVANCNPLRSEYLPDQIACFVGAASTEAVLEANCSQLEGVRWMNRELPGDSTVVFVAESRAFGVDFDVILDDAFQKPMLAELAELSASEAELSRRLNELGASHIFFNRAESQRIAIAEGRTEYLEFSSDAARSRFRAWLRSHTRVVASGEWWEVRAIDGS